MLVLDANILIRAVLGHRVRGLLIKYGGRVDFFAPDVAFDEAREHLPGVLQKRRVPVGPAVDILASLGELVQVVEFDTYSGFESVARQRLAVRDMDDWPVLAAALTLRCPIWTEDTDFFGSGVATWTSDRVELYLRAAVP
ncbi:MAG: PIN domain-containing protein [Bryobacteraceae bacterium]|jgi:predicted nucleic acid-binding protein